jgi:hypothetical protein
LSPERRYIKSPVWNYLQYLLEIKAYNTIISKIDTIWQQRSCGWSKEGKLIRIGYGLYAKARTNHITGLPMLASDGGFEQRRLTECPGYLGLQDTHYVGTIKGVGRIYQQTFIDTYSGVATAKLYIVDLRLGIKAEVEVNRRLGDMDNLSSGPEDACIHAGDVRGTTRDTRN